MACRSGEVPETKKADEVGALRRFRKWFDRLSNGRGDVRESGRTAEFSGMPSESHISGRLKLKVGVISVRGNYREHNEDNFYVPGRGPVDHDGPLENGDEHPSLDLDSRSLFIVADGMGGQQAGEQASRMAVELIPKAAAKRLGSELNEPSRVKDALRDAIAEVNQEILGSSGAVTEFSNMGTTVVLAHFQDERVFVAGIGDSRAYRFRDGRLEQLTQDHSLADALLQAGTITRDELPNHRFKNVLYLYLGSKDARGGPEDVRALDVHPHDRFLLASDGLTGVVPDDQIAEILGTVDDPQQAAKILKDLALSNDSKDNVTCLVIHAVVPPDQEAE